jgi:2-methylcitrate dehydratase
LDKFKENLATRFPARQNKAIFDLCQNQERLEKMPVNEFMDMWVI